MLRSQVITMADPSDHDAPIFADHWIRGLQETEEQVRDALGAWSDSTTKNEEPS